MKSSAVSAERFLEMAWRMGKNTSKLTRASAFKFKNINDVILEKLSIKYLVGDCGSTS